MSVVGGKVKQESAGSIRGKTISPRAARPGLRSEVRPEDLEDASDARLWGPADVSRYLGIPVSSIYKMTAKTATVRIPLIRIGGRLRFKKRDLDQWLTLLTVSNLDVLHRLRQRTARTIHGNHQQEETS